MPDRPAPHRRPDPKNVAVDRSRKAEFEEHIAQLDAALATAESASAIAALLRERRMTLNAIEGLTITGDADGGVDDIAERRRQRRAAAAKKASAG